MCRMWKKSNNDWRQAVNSAQSLFRQMNGGERHAPDSSGNQAFDEHMRRKLEEIEAMRLALLEEKREFDAFLLRLKQAKDLEEFRSFLAARDAPPAAQA